MKTLFTITLAVLLAVACKKEEDETPTPSGPTGTTGTTGTTGATGTPFSRTAKCWGYSNHLPALVHIKYYPNDTAQEVSIWDTLTSSNTYYREVTSPFRHGFTYFAIGTMAPYGANDTVHAKMEYCNSVLMDTSAYPNSLNAAYVLKMTE